MSDWISPSAAMDMVFHDPAGAGKDAGFTISLLRRTLKGKRMCVSDLVRAKLQPREPSEAETITSGSGGWPVTAYAHQLVLARGAPEARSVRALCEQYDEDTGERHRLLAIVMTMRFGHDDLHHDSMAHAVMFAQICLAHNRHVSSLVVQHVPAEGASNALPHCHIVSFARLAFPSGWGGANAIFSGKPEDVQRELEREWTGFSEKWNDCKS
jgi:hypothetical protein